MEKQYLLGIDIGTSAAKVALFSRDGGNRPVGVTSAEYPIFYPAPGYVEQNAEHWWEAVVRATRELLEKTSVPAGAIAGIGRIAHDRTVCLRACVEHEAFDFDSGCHDAPLRPELLQRVL